LDIFCTYERHYGLSGHPFANTPDLGFFFDSRGHSLAFAYLQGALLEGDCVMVLTGETGSGKTMLLRKLLEGLEAEGIVAAQPTEMAPAAQELLRSILLAFNAPSAGSSIEAMRAELRTFLASLASTGRRGLVVFDEAHQLLPDGIDVLLELARPPSVDDAGLQVLLVGQPELRASVANTIREPGPPFFLFCDVGLLSPLETRAYIEHRLGHVHWNRSPSFSDDAHERIYRTTGGVPRLINRLCNRLLMTAAEREQTTISAKLVDETCAELREPVAGPTAQRTSRLPADPIPTLTSIVDDHGSAVDHVAHAHASPEDSAIPTLFSVVDTMPSAQQSDPPLPETGMAHYEFTKNALNPGSRVRWVAIVCVLIACTVAIIWLDYHYETSTQRAVAPPATATGSIDGIDDIAAINPTVAGVPPAPAPADRRLPGETDTQQGASPPAPSAVTPVAPAEALPAAPVITAKSDTTQVESRARKSDRRKAARRHSETKAQSAQLASKGTPATDRLKAPKRAAATPPCTPAIAALGLCTPSSTQ
jgi:type II secretory pathway predicted ATPase ExeA